MQDKPLDILLMGGTVVDGTGATRFTADVGVRDGRIVLVGDGKGRPARQTLKVDGLVVAPGFIDSHAHDDWAVMAHPAMAPKVSQGVTTVVNGNCGNSLAPFKRGSVPPLPMREVAAEFQFETFDEYLQTLEARPAAVNVASLLGHTSLRVRCMADLTRPATPAEIVAMRDIARGALEAGALGLSTGTFYPAAAAATLEEIVAVGADLREFGGLYATHMRNEGDEVMASLDESAAIARALGVPLVVSHHKVMGAKNFGRTVETLEKLRFMAQSQDICLDCYPYTASSSLLRLERLNEASEIIVTTSKGTPEANGCSITALAERWACSREEALRRVMPGMGMYFMMDEADVQRVLAYPPTMVGSDGISIDNYPHPRLWGSFTRVLGHYSRDLGLFPLEVAVHKMTGMTADAYGLVDRGRIAPGMAADIAVFDPASVIDRATYTAPMQPSDGIRHVIVNGEPVLLDGAGTGARPGRTLRRHRQ